MIFSQWYASESYRDSLSEIGRKEKDMMLFDRIALEKHVYVATKAQRIQNSKHWILTLNAEGPQQALNQPPDFAQAKRECKRLHDEHLARTQQDYRTIPRSDQVRQGNEKQFEGTEEFDYAVVPKTGWRFYKGSRRNRQLRHRHRIRIEPIGRRAIGILCILQGLTILWFFSELGPVSVAWRKTSSLPTGGVNSTPTNKARTELHSMITFHHANTRCSRAGRLRIAHLCVLKTIVIHVSCLIPLPRLTLTTSTSSRSPTPPIFPTISPTHTGLSLPHLSFRQFHQRTQDFRYTMNIYPSMFHGRVADLCTLELSPRDNQLDRKTILLEPSQTRPKASVAEKKGLSKLGKIWVRNNTCAGTPT